MRAAPLHVFQTCSLPTTVNHGKSVPRFFTPSSTLIVLLFLNFERKFWRGNCDSSGGDEFSRLNFSRFNFLKRDAAGALTKFSFLVATRGKQSRETSSPLEVDRSGSASGKLKMATEFSWYRARFFRRNLPRLV